MNGYLTKFEIFMQDTYRIENFGISNNKIYKSITGPLHIIGSCLENVCNMSSHKIISYIVEEDGCPLVDAIQKIGDYGSEITFYHDAKWSKEIHDLSNTNIGISDDILKTDNLFLVGIYSNVNNIFLSSQQLFEFIIFFVLLGFILFKIGIFIKGKIETFRKNKKIMKVIKFNGVEGESCTICLEEFNQQEMLMILNCSHLFHKECIEEWLEKKPICPNCNQPIYDETTSLLN